MRVGKLNIFQDLSMTISTAGCLYDQHLNIYIDMTSISNRFFYYYFVLSHLLILVVCIYISAVKSLFEITSFIRIFTIFPLHVSLFLDLVIFLDLNLVRRFYCILIFLFFMFLHSLLWMNYRWSNRIFFSLTWFRLIWSCLYRHMKSEIDRFSPLETKIDELKTMWLI